MAHNSVFRFKFVASYECEDRQSCPSTEKEIDCLSDYYSRHAARTFIPSQYIPRYEVVPVEDDASFRTCKCDANGTHLRNNKSRTRCLVTLRTKCKLIGLMKTCSKFRNDQETEILTLLSGLYPRRNFTR
ncbi:hypothetical protein CAJAP_07019 [Camponotus japonicus]